MKTIIQLMKSIENHRDLFEQKQCSGNRKDCDYPWRPDCPFWNSEEECCLYWGLTNLIGDLYNLKQELSTISYLTRDEDEEDL